MEWSEKIDSRKYLLGSVLALGFAAYAGKGVMIDTSLLFGVVFGSILNQWLMVKILAKALNKMTSGAVRTSGSGWFALQIVLKLSVLGCLFYGLIAYGRHLAAYGIILYTFQLIILVLSIKSSSTFLNKGPPT